MKYIDNSRVVVLEQQEALLELGYQFSPTEQIQATTKKLGMHYSSSFLLDDYDMVVPDDRDELAL